MGKKKKPFINKYYNLVKKINKNSSLLWLPKNDYNKKHIITNTWFNIKEFKKKDNIPHKVINKNIPLSKNKEVIRCEKIKMFVTRQQHKILQEWMNAYISMYNYTLKLIKTNRHKIILYKKKHNDLINKYIKLNRTNKKKINIINKLKQDCLKKNINYNVVNFPNNFRDFRNLCTTKLKKKQFQKHYMNVNLHILDQAIKDVFSMYKSCLTNYKNGNIKHFRMRYMRYTNKCRILKIEKCLVSKSRNVFCSSCFKQDFKFENNFSLANVGGDFIIYYNRLTNKYLLLNPKTEKVNKPHNKTDTVGIDLGLRTFATCFSNNKWVQIADGNLYKLKKHLNRIDLIKKSNLTDPKKTKACNTQYKHIKNYIDELHWKTINYLTKNFGNIIIGNLTTSSILRKENKLNKMSKRLIQCTSYYTFLKRLEYKCKKNGIGFVVKDEAYTSKTCTKCGHKYDVGSNKIYKCKNAKCKIILDRDLVGSRNIMMLY